MTHKEKAEHHAEAFYRTQRILMDYQLPNTWHSERQTLIRRHWRERIKRKAIK